MSWDGRIAAVSMNNVNSEVGYSGTATTTFNDNRVRRLANRTTGSSPIEMRNMRFGLQLPMDDYTTSNTVSLNAFSIEIFNPPIEITSYVELEISSGGSGAYRTKQHGAAEQTVKSFLWLETIMGSAGDYEVNLTVNSGDNPNSGPSINTWLSLSSGRTWRWSVTRSSLGSTTLSSDSTIFIRRSTEIGPFRNFSIFAYAELSL